MQEMTVYTPGNVTAQREINNGLFSEFVSFVDRSPKTTRTYLTNLKQFAAWLNYSCITCPTRLDIIAYRDYLNAEHEAIVYNPVTGWNYRTTTAGEHIIVKCKANTVTQYLRSVKELFAWTAAAGYYPNIAADVHAPKIRNDIHRKEALTPKDVLTIEKSIEQTATEREATAALSVKDTAGRIQRSTEQGKRLYAMYLLAVTAGLRTIEISRANIKDIETRSGKAVLYIWGKGHTEPDQRKPIAPQVYDAIQDYIKTRTDNPTSSSPLFVSTGNRSKGKRIAPTTISTMLKQAMQQAGYNSEKITAHSLRHTCGTTAMQLTGNIYTTQKYMRHSNPATTELYLHNETEQAEAGIAQRIYNEYHGIESAEQAAPEREQLETVIATLAPEQLRKLFSIASAM